MDLDQQIIKSMTPAQKQTIFDVCPTKVFSYNESTDVLDIEDAFNCVNCDECVKASTKMEKKGAITIGEMDDQYIFTVEATGSIKPEIVVEKALDILSKKLDDVAKEL